ncbi:N-acetyltransferase family protein [Sphingomonas sp. 28-63-12]|uniref:GNAT family N-acetyltransferase n=1 Tax=Sphingomonas sp. 28-63-12 TaxID=1970434 RepID=UPI0035A82FC7
MLAIRRATRNDVPEIHRLLLAFGRHWHREHWVSGTQAALDKALFGHDLRGFAHVAALDDTVVGIALWYLTYNFWLAEPVLFLEDLYVDEPARGSGAGEALLRALAAEALDRDCAWMDWIVRTDNEATKRFYARHGGTHNADFDLWRMEGDQLRALAEHR